MKLKLQLVCVNTPTFCENHSGGLSGSAKGLIALLTETL